MATSARKGQAMVELAAGMFALALVLAALLTFSRYILSSLEEQRRLRADAGIAAMNSSGMDESYSSAHSSLEVPVEPLAADWMLPEETLKVDESVHIPYMKEVMMP